MSETPDYRVQRAEPFEPMDKIIYITPNFAVTSALEPVDFAAAAALGFRHIVSNRPDGEETGQLTGRDEATHAWRNGLTFSHVPASKLDLFTDPVVERTRLRQTPEGEIPSPLDPPSGCVFRTRCRYAEARCASAAPELRALPHPVGAHHIACHRAEEIAS